jgi:transcriptional regulator with XRE-family HTH domain
MTDNALGAFLRARRAALRPADVGMPTHGVRRVAGLRREEVAVLAGVNADYYARLEQGRERHPSPQVLASLGRALRLDADARDHLGRLAGVPSPGPPAGAPDTVDATLRQLLDGYPHTPAFVIGRTLDILTANALAQALFSPFGTAGNLARMIFLDPAARTFHVHWEEAADAAVANLRQAAGFPGEGPRVRALVAELSGRSPEFAALWEAQAVRGKTRGVKHLRHPDVGPLTVTYHTFDVRDAPGQQLVIYHAEPGGPGAQALALLGSLAATRRPHPAP